MIRWNPDKDKFLRTSRGVSFQQITGMIISGDCLETLENPGRSEQDVFVVKKQGYTWVVPFMVEDNDTIFLKTAYPSRKFHKRYRDKNEPEG